MSLRHFFPLRRLTVLTVSILCFLSLAEFEPSWAQVTTGNLVGQVRDRGGNGLPEAKVMVVNSRNGHRSATKANKNGGFIIPDLPPGAYHIVASKEKFRPTCIPRLPLYLNRNNSVKYPPNINLLPAGGNDPVCQELKLALTNDDQGRGDVGAHSGSVQLSDVSGFDDVDADSSHSGPRASGFGLMITLERELGETASPNAEQPQAAQSGQGAAGNLPTSGVEAAGVVNTVDAMRSANFTEQQIESLPLGAASFMRAFDELALLVAGVAPPPYTPGVRGPGVGFGVGTAGQFSVNGARARANNFSVDGSDTNDPDVGVRRGGYVAQSPQSLESIQEVSISTLLWNAELGRRFGSQVNAVSKYGGNDFHGQAYGFFNDSRLNARNFFDYGAKDPFTRTQAGIAVGGPLVHDRTHFFAGFEGAKVNSSIEQHFATPTCAERALFPNISTPQCGGNVDQIPPGFFIESISVRNFLIAGRGGATALGRAVFSSYPPPNNPGGPYGENTLTQSLPAGGRGVVTSMRLTQIVGASHTLNARYNLTDDNRVLPSVNQAINSTIGSDTRSQSLSFIFDSRITPRLFNQARFSFGRTRSDFPEHPLGPFLLPAATRPGDIYKTKLGDDDDLGERVNFGASTVGNVGELIIQPFSPVGVNTSLFPQGRVNNTFQYADTMSLHWGDHSLRFGADIRRIQLNSFQDRLYRQQVNFDYGLAEFGSGRSFQFTPDGTPLFALTGAQLAALPMPSSIIQTLTSGPPNSHIGLRITEDNFFLNDNWRARPNLTLDYGLRYEYSSVPSEVNRRIEDAITLRGLRITPPGQLFCGGCFGVSYIGLDEAYKRVLGARTSIYDPDRNNFGPHFGFAWDPRSDGKMSVRAGYGIYYDAILGSVVSQSRNVFPREVTTNVSAPFFDELGVGLPLTPGSCQFVVCMNGVSTNQIANYIDPISLIDQFIYFLYRRFNDSGVDLGGLRLDPGLSFTLPDKRLRTPYSQQWHLTLEREAFNGVLVSAAYVGAKGTKLMRQTTPNLGASNTFYVPIVNRRLPAPKPGLLANYYIYNSGIYDPAIGNLQSFFSRPQPRLGFYQFFENSAASNYHALQIEASRRYGASLNFTLAYTWSHAIDNVSDIFPISGAPILPQNNNDLKAERASANFDIRHRFTASFVWDLPFNRNRNDGIAKLLGGWRLASIIQAQTGQPFTLNLPLDANLDGNLSDRPSTTQELIFFDGHDRRRVAPLSGAKLEDFFSLKITRDSRGRITAIDRKDGAIGRNTVRGDSFINLDLALSKTFRFTERQSLDFRTEFFNLFNRANFGLPVRILDAPAFGSAVDTVNPARMIQFALKYSF